MSLRKLNRSIRPGTAKRRKKVIRKEFATREMTDTAQVYWTLQASMRGYFGDMEAFAATKKARRVGFPIPNHTKED